MMLTQQEHVDKCKFTRIFLSLNIKQDILKEAFIDAVGHVNGLPTPYRPFSGDGQQHCFAASDCRTRAYFWRCYRLSFVCCHQF